MPDQVNSRLTLFQYDISDQWLVRTIGWFHIKKENFIVDRSEAFNLDPDRSADFTVDCFLRSGLHFGTCYRFHRTEAVTPGNRKHHER